MFCSCKTFPFIHYKRDRWCEYEKKGGISIIHSIAPQTGLKISRHFIIQPVPRENEIIVSWPVHIQILGWVVVPCILDETLYISPRRNLSAQNNYKEN